MRHWRTGAVLLALLLPLAGAQAKGEVTAVTVEGPGTFSALVLEDPEVVARLALGHLEAVERPLDPPAGLGPGFLLTRYTDRERARAFDRLVVFLDPEGGSGYVYYLGMVDAAGPYDGRWYRLRAEGARTLEAALRAAGVRSEWLPGGEAPAPSTRPDLLPWLTGLAGLAVGGLLGARIGSRRRP